MLTRLLARHSTEPPHPAFYLFLGFRMRVKRGLWGVGGDEGEVSGPGVQRHASGYSLQPGASGPVYSSGPWGCGVWEQCREDTGAGREDLGRQRSPTLCTLPFPVHPRPTQLPPCLRKWDGLRTGCQRPLGGGEEEEGERGDWEGDTACPQVSYNQEGGRRRQQVHRKEQLPQGPSGHCSQAYH